ncbi:uncharacterized protein LOC134283583 [Saccostrea cucullata]|uniref:uncharacterized protein LOC134283583 n=1 Tax=Saccostrea cuccullata TaxID=36930 RepID=UPI002ED57591
MSNETEDKTKQNNERDMGSKDFIVPTEFGAGLITTICLSALVMVNLIFTFFFYRAWKKRQEVRRRQSTIEMNTNNSYSALERMTRHVYSDVRDSRISFQSDRYATIQSVTKAKETEISKESVPPLRAIKRDRLKTLTTLFSLHSNDVNRTVSRLKAIETGVR